MKLMNFFIATSWGLGLVLAENPDDLLAVTTVNRVIERVLNDIKKETQDLDEILHEWDGTMLGALSIDEQTSVIMEEITQGTKDSRASTGLTLFEALGVRFAIIQLLKATRIVTKDLIDMKQRFRAISQVEKVKTNLKNIQGVSGELNEVVVDRLPSIVQFVGRNLGQLVHVEFQKAIDEYDKKDPAPNQGPLNTTRDQQAALHTSSLSTASEQ
ncbi:unnamed protein product [Discula destructiva]